MQIDKVKERRYDIGRSRSGNLQKCSSAGPGREQKSASFFGAENMTTVQRSTLIVPGGVSFVHGGSFNGIGSGSGCIIESLGRAQAEVHKYHLNLHRGYDLGPSALHDWCKRYWRPFVRWRHFEHVTGQVAYPEFSPFSHGCLASYEWPNDPVAIYAVMCVRDRLFENLDFFKPENPIPSHICPKKLKDVLEMMDSDSARLPVPEWGRA